MLPTDFAIFSPVALDHPVVHPDRGQLVPARGPRLRGLVLVVGEERGPSRRRGCRSRRRAASSAIAEHSMCQPGRPRAPRRSPRRCPRPPCCAFQSAKSSGSSLQSAPSTPSPWSMCVDVAVRQLAVARGPSARGSRRRPRPRRRGPRSISACDQLDDLADRLRWRAARGRGGRARARRCRRCTRRSSPARAARWRRPARAPRRRSCR